MTPEIEGYRIGALVHEDALFQGFEATHRDPAGRERPVRVTVVARREGDEAVAGFEPDVDAVRALGDRGPVAVLAAGRTAQGHLYVVQPPEPGRSLAELLEQNGTLSPELAARIGADVARELAAAHAMEPPLAHLALRPSSVRIGADGFARLDDFAIGRAAMVLASEQTAVLEATCRYMAPEQVDPRGAPGPMADLFGLASVLYEAVAGAAPFEGGTALGTTLKVSMAKPPSLGELPDGLAAVLSRLWSKDPSDRGDAARAAQELAEAAGREADARRALKDASGAAGAEEPPPLKRFDAFAEGDEDRTDLQIELPNYVPTDVSLPLPASHHAPFDAMEEATSIDASAQPGSAQPPPASISGDSSVPATAEIANPDAGAPQWTDSTVPLQAGSPPPGATASALRDAAPPPVSHAQPPPRATTPFAPQTAPVSPSPLPISGGLEPPRRHVGPAPDPPAGPPPRPRGLPPIALWLALGAGAILVVALTALAAVWIAG